MFWASHLDVQALKFALDAAYRRPTLTRELGAVRNCWPRRHVKGCWGQQQAMAGSRVIRKVAGRFHQRADYG